MTTLHETELHGALTLDQQEQLALILEKHMQLVEAGAPVTSESLLDEHPEFAAHLKPYLEGLEFLNRAAHELHCAQATPTFEKRQLGDYELIREIGRGGMGIVYEARQKSLDRRVAIKVLPFAAVLDEKQIARFTREAQSAAQLHHANIVPVYGVGCELGVHYYSMQLIDGQTVDALIAQLKTSKKPNWQFAETQAAIDTSIQESSVGLKTFDSGMATGSIGNRDRHRRMAELAKQAALGLEHAHQLGVIHRDVKPSNLLIDRQGKLWITDFGLARLQSDSQVTATGDVVGTLRYMSPEQASGRSAYVDPRTDIYSLGVSLFEMLTLTTPFEDSDRVALLRRIEAEEPPSLRKYDTSIPSALENIVLKALSKDRDHRYESCDEFALDLDRFLVGKPTLAKQPTVVERMSKWAARHRTIVAATVLLLVVATLLTSASAVLLNRKQKETEAALDQANASYHELVLSAISLRDVPGAERARQILLATALRSYEQRKTSTAKQSELAQIELRIGQIYEDIGNTEQALKAFTAASRRFAHLVDASPEVTGFRQALAISRNNSGMMHLENEHTEEAIEELRGAMAIQQKLVDSEADNLEYKIDLANTYSNLGECYGPTEIDTAEDYYQRSIDILRTLVKRFPDSTLPLSRLAIVYNNTSKLLGHCDLVTAERLTRQGLELQRQLVKGWPDQYDFQRDLALCLNNFATFCTQKNATSDAQVALGEAIELQERLVRVAPAVIAHQRELIVSHNNLGRLQYQSKHYDDASKSFFQAGLLLKQLMSDYPEESRYPRSLKGILTNLDACVRMLRETGSLEEALRIERRMQLDWGTQP